MALEIIIKGAGGQSVATERIAETLRGLPGVQASGNYFTYQDDEAGLFLDVVPGSRGSGGGVLPGADLAGECDRLLVRAPSDLEPALREALADFCFSLARRFRWQVTLGAETPFANEAAFVKRLGGGSEPIGRNSCLSVLILGVVSFCAWRLMMA